LLAVFTAPFVRRSLRRYGYARTVGTLSKRRRKAVDHANVRRVGASADAVLRRLPLKLTCLERSVVVWWVIGGSEVADIQFGVRPSKASIPDFHAWVVADGVVINDRADVTADFFPFPDFPASQVESKRFST
jgi:hypothetical protein